MTTTQDNPLLEQQIYYIRFSKSVTISLRSRRLEVAGKRENGRASRAPVVFLCPLLPSACYAGYITIFTLQEHVKTIN